MYLEPEGWTHGDAKVVVRSIVEIHEVAHFKTHSNRSAEELNATTRIQNTIGIAAGDAAELAAERAVRAEVEEAALNDGECTNRSATGLELRAEHAMQEPQSGLIDRNRSAVGGGSGEALLEVVGHLGFQLHVRMNVEANPSAESKEVGIICVVQAYIVGEGADLNVVLREYGWRRHQDQRRDQS